MTRVWYCRNCGYEVTSRGRCHACREKLVASALPQLSVGSEEDEVGYRLGEWEDLDRGQLIEKLNELAIAHRFEDDELVVDLEDESRVDDLVAMVAASVPAGDGAHGDGHDGDGDWGDGADGNGSGHDPVDPAVSPAVKLLAHAANRLREDPTDMQADGDVAEASAAVFMVDRFGPLDEDHWLAVGRVTRNLLAFLGADEALEDDIRLQASILAKLLHPVSGAGVETRPHVVEEGAGTDNDHDGEDADDDLEAADVEAADVEDADIGGTRVGGSGVEGAGLGGAEAEADEVGPTELEGRGAEGTGFGGTEADGAESEGDEAEVAETGGVQGDRDEDAAEEDEEEQTVYELPEWLPEQRAHLELLLEDAGIAYEWDEDELVVPVERESEVEDLFGQVASVPGDDDDDGEERYQAIAELFAATGRLAGDPSDKEKAALVVQWAHESDGPPLLGMDDVYWLRIRTSVKALVSAIENEEPSDQIRDEANNLHSLLRSVV